MIANEKPNNRKTHKCTRNNDDYMALFESLYD